MRKLSLSALLAIGLMAALPLFAAAQTAPTITTEKIAANVYLVSDSAGMGNVAVCYGPDGILVVDSKIEFLLAGLKEALAQINNQPPKFLVNTHCHFDHVDGNRGFADGNTRIIAHKATYDYMRQPQKLTGISDDLYPALTPATGLPDMIFADVLDLKFNGTTVQMVHIGPGHTGGDIVVIFTEENIMHVADLMFNGTYPYVGIDAGGSLNFMIETAAKVAELMDDKTIVIPGHGSLTTKAEFLAFYEMLATVRDNIVKAIQDGKTMEEVVTLKPTAAYDAKYGQLGQPLAVDDAVRLYYLDLARFQN